jgi:hypothetical protein
MGAEIFMTGGLVCALAFAPLEAEYVSGAQAGAHLFGWRHGL